VNDILKKLDTMGASQGDVDQEEPFLMESQERRRHLRPRKIEHFQYLCLALLLLSIITHATVFMLWIKSGTFSKADTPRLYSKSSHLILYAVETYE